MRAAARPPSMRRRVLAGLVVGFVLGCVSALVAANLQSGEKVIRQRIGHAYSVADPQFLRAIGALLGPPITAGNDAQTLLNGDEIFPAMLEAIGSARHSITFETYIYWSGEVGRRFAAALSERARVGVRVHVLLDWVGSQKMDDALLDSMRAAGVQVEKYHRPKWPYLDRLNNRTHRKLLVVDGRIGFTGGVGIADKWSGHAQDPEHWRDTHYRVEGPAVAQMQAAFADNWAEVTGTVLHAADYFPPLAPLPDGQFAQVFHSSAEGGADSMHLMYLMSIASASRSIRLSMAYFVPDELAMQALLDAAARGVSVKIILPGPITDAELVQKASRAQWGRALEAGIEIREYQPTMFHCKVLIVDELWVSVGSTNFDTRSFRLNDEANLNVWDRRFAGRQVADFEDDLRRSRRVTLEEWAARPLLERLQERAAALAGAQL